MRQISIVLSFLILAYLCVLSFGTHESGICYSQRSQRVLVTRSRQGSQTTSYRCGSWWRRRRCSRTVYHTEYYTTTETRYYSERHCCFGYRNYNGACRKVVIGLERTSYSVAEDVGTVRVCATIRTSVGMENIPLAIEMRTVDSGAISPSDFSSISAIKSLTPSARRQCLIITINYDYLSESAESFRVTISGRHLPPYVSLSPSFATITIQNVFRMRIGFQRDTYNVNEDAGSVSVCALLHEVAGSVRPTEVTFRTAPDEARSPADFTSVTRSVTFTNSLRIHCVTIPIVHDSLHEFTEDFTVHLTSTLSVQSHLTLDPAIARVYITSRHPTIAPPASTTIRPPTSPPSFTTAITPTAPWSSGHFIVCTRSTIGRVTLDGRRHQVLVTNLRNAVAIDYNYRFGVMYWTDSARGLIMRSNLDGSSPVVLVRGLHTLDGLAVDWLANKVYVTDSLLDLIGVYDAAAHSFSVVIRTGPGTQPRAIALDPRARMMYFTDWGTVGRIEKASLDGTNRVVIHNTNLIWPNALTLDITSQTLYWMDARLDKLEKSNVDGTGRTLLAHAGIIHPFSMVIHGNTIYFTDWAGNHVKRVSTSGGAVSNVFSTNILTRSTLFGVQIVDPLRQQ